jgi:bacteriorhodopsin
MAGKNKNFPWYVTAQGVMLAGWLAVQLVLIRTVYFLHFIMGAVAVLLVLVGMLLNKTKSNPTS